MSKSRIGLFFMSQYFSKFLTIKKYYLKIDLLLIIFKNLETLNIRKNLKEC